MKKRILTFILSILILGSSTAFANDESIVQEQPLAVEKVCDVIITEVTNPPDTLVSNESSVASLTEGNGAGNNDSSVGNTADTIQNPKEDLNNFETPADVEDNPSEYNSDALSDPQAINNVENSQISLDGNNGSDESAELQAKKENPSEDSNIQQGNTSDVGEGNSTSNIASTKSGRTVKLNSWTYGEAYNGSSYCSLKFNFTSEPTADDQNPAEYCAYITGVNITHADGSALVNDDKALEKLLVDIADSFYAKSPVMLVNKDCTINGQNCTISSQHNIVIDSIDAEKTFSKVSGKEDNLLCWAASTSDMLEYSGWNAKVKNSDSSSQKFTDEDAILDYYQTNWTNVGGTSEKGNKWFLNGINYSQTVKDGVVVFDGTGSSSQTKNSTEGSFFNNRAAEEEIMNYDVKVYSASALSDAADGLEKGNSAGLGIYTVQKDGTIGGGHAITLFGYIKDIAQQGIDALKAIFITDSDTFGTDTETNRSNFANSVEMYTLSPYEYKANNQTVDTVSMDNYVSGSTYMVSDVTVLKKYSETTADPGTKNATNTVDYSPSCVGVYDLDWENQIYSADVGDAVKLVVDINNYSYQKLDYSQYKDKDLSVFGRFEIYCNGQLVDTVKTEISLSETSYVFNPLSGTSFCSNYTFNKAGTYNVMYYLDGLYYLIGDNKYQRIDEAYFGNNICRNTSIFTVNSKSKEENVNPSVPNVVIVPVYSEIFSYGQACYSISIRENKDSISSIIFNGEPLDSALWSVIQNSDGTVTVSFDSDFVNHVFPGTYDLRILNSDGVLVAILKIEFH